MTLHQSFQSSTELLEHVEEQPQETTVPRPTPSENFAEHTINTQKEEQIHASDADSLQVHVQMIFYFLDGNFRFTDRERRGIAFRNF